MPNFSKAIKVSAITAGILAGLLVLALACIELMIGWGVVSQSRKAMAQFPGDRVEALIGVVNCGNCTLEDRNHAVWALGQLRDRRALPVLYKYRTGQPCNHLRTICQYEIIKAIRWTEGNSYMVPQLWRVMLGKDRPSFAVIHS